MIAFAMVAIAKQKEKEGMLAKAREWLASLPEAAAVIPEFIRNTQPFKDKLASMRRQGQDFLAAVQANDQFHIPPFSLPEPATEIQGFAKEIFEKRLGMSLDPTPQQAEEFKRAFEAKVEETLDIEAEKIIKEPPPKDDRKPGVYFMTPAYEVEKPPAEPVEKAPRQRRQPVVQSTIEGDTRDPMLRLGFAILNGNKKQAANLRGLGWYTDHNGDLHTKQGLGEEAPPTQEEIQKELENLQKTMVTTDLIKEQLGMRMTDLSKDIGKIVRNDAMFKAANGVAMAVAGIIVGCMAVPVVGWIVAAVLAVVSAMMTMIDKKYMAQVQALSNAVQNRIRMYQIMVDTKLKNETLNIYEATYDKAFNDVKTELDHEFKRLGLDKPLKPTEAPPAVQAADQAATQAAAESFEGLGTTPEEEAARKRNMAAAVMLYFGMNPGAQAAFSNAWQHMVHSFNYNWEQFAKANASAQRQMTKQITTGFENVARDWNRAWQEMTGQKVEDESTWDKVKGGMKDVWNKFRPYAPLAAGMPPEAWSHYSGMNMVKQVSAKLAQLEATGKQQIDLTYLAQKKQLNNQTYRDNLYLQLKQAILQSPQVQTIVQNMMKAAKGREDYYKRLEHIKQLKAKAAVEQATTAPPTTTQPVDAQTAPATPTAMAPSTVQPPKKKSKAPLVIGAGAAALAAFFFLR